MSLTCYLKIRSFPVALLALLAGLFCLPGMAHAQEVNEELITSDVRLVIDVSGSMKRNDPNNLRQPAVDLLMRLLPEGAKAGVWTFGKYVNMLVPHRDVSEEWKADAKEQAKEINSVGLFTNIGGALEKAAYDSERPDPDRKTSIILLTDGMVDIDKDPSVNNKEWTRIVDEVLPKLKQAGYTVHTVALSENADRDLLQKLALGTDGIAEVAESSEDLMKIFLKAFDVAVPSQQVPLENNSFVVDSSVEEFTALIFRRSATEDTVLIGPDENKYSPSTKEADINWHKAENYDLVTVKQPLEGQWQVIADLDPDSRITVVSDLSLKVKPLPNNIFSGVQSTLSFVLLEDGKTIKRDDFLKLLSNSAVMAYGRGDTPTQQIWSKDFSQQMPPANGVYSAELPIFDKVGVYDIQVNVDGKTFTRQFTHRVTVREPFSAELSKKVNDEGVEQDILTVRSHGEDTVANKTQVVATIMGPDRRKKIKPLSLTQFQNWQSALLFEKPGQYRVDVSVTGRTTNNEEFEYHLKPLTYNYDPEAEFAELVEPQASSSSSQASVESSSSVSSIASSSAASAVSSQDETQDKSDVEDEAELTEQPSKGLPPWVLYLVLGLGNLFILGGGFFLFKKLFAEPDGDVLDKFSDDAIDEKEEAEPEPELTSEPEIKAELMEMDSGESDDEEPPMEDLDPVDDSDDDMDESDDLADMVQAQLNEEAPAAPADEPEPDDSMDESEDDFGLDDIEDEPEPDEDEDSSFKPKVDGVDENDEEFAQEMLKAQGLDLAEDELDDAISNLIDELDDEPASDKKKDDDDLDFDDFGLDEDDDK